MRLHVLQKLRTDIEKHDRIRPSKRVFLPRRDFSCFTSYPIHFPGTLLVPSSVFASWGFMPSRNKHLGVSGGYVQLLDVARHRPIEKWRLWFLGGLLLGGVLEAIIGTDTQSGLAYGALGKLLPLTGLIPVLLVGSVLLGFGARWAGGCTSGHGITGSSTRSMGSMVAVATFMVTAVAATFVLHAATGGCTVKRLYAVSLFFGSAFGFFFCAAGFNRYDTIHRMLLLQNSSPYLVMASAVLTAMPLLWLLERRKWRTPLAGDLALVRWPVERKHLVGGTVFGVGWAITGACPGTISGMIGAGSILGGVTLVGFMGGIVLRDSIVERDRSTALCQ